MSELFPIVTSRLRLESFVVETLERLLCGDTRGAESVHGITFSMTFLQSLHEDFLAIQLARIRSRPSGRSWCIRAIVRDEDNAVMDTGDSTDRLRTLVVPKLAITFFRPTEGMATRLRPSKVWLIGLDSKAAPLSTPP